MNSGTLDFLTNWAIFVFTGVGLVLLVKSIALLFMGEIKRVVLHFAGLALWVLFTLFLLSLAIASGMNHASFTDAASAVYVISLTHTVAGAVIAYFLLRLRAERTVSENEND